MRQTPSEKWAIEAFSITKFFLYPTRSKYGHSQPKWLWPTQTWQPWHGVKKRGEMGENSSSARKSRLFFFLRRRRRVAIIFRVAVLLQFFFLPRHKKKGGRGKGRRGELAWLSLLGDVGVASTKKKFKNRILNCCKFGKTDVQKRSL